MNNVRSLQYGLGTPDVKLHLHFGILKERGLEQAPRQIERLLKDSGFSFTWTDSSQVLTVRKF